MLPLPHPIPPPPDHEETRTEFPDSEFLSIHKPINNNKKSSLSEQEKQISIDPISLKESSPPHPPPSSTTIATAKAKFTAQLPPLLPPTKSKFLSTSLPSSTTSSPRFSSSLSKKKHWKINQIQPSPPTPASSSVIIDPLSRQHSVALSRLAQLQEKHLRRSKSCGDGRATSPYDDFDRLSWLNTKVNKNGTVVKKDESLDAYHDDDDNHGRDEKFKCGALCLFLPGFGRGKPVRPRKDLEIGNGNGNEFHRKEKKKGKEVITGVMSRTVSLEKFECGSWTSSAIIMDQNHEDQDGDPTNNLFFDLPLELIRNEMNDADSPVTAAFVFDKQMTGGDRKGVLKKSSSSSSSSGSRGGNCNNNGRKSHQELAASTRHVRFCSNSNNSSPRSQPTSPASSCISPRLRRARDDFNAFLQAQSA